MTRIYSADARESDFRSEVKVVILMKGFSHCPAFEVVLIEKVLGRVVSHKLCIPDRSLHSREKIENAVCADVETGHVSWRIRQ